MNLSRALLAPLVILAAVLLYAESARAENLVANGSFERVENGAPADWVSAGDGAVAQQLSAGAGKVGRHAAKLHCSAYDRQGPSSHAMLAQVGKVALTKGGLYRFSCWMRCERMAGRHVRVAISDTARWSNCGLSASFRLGRAWRRYETFFTATASVRQSTRLQFWYGEVGTLWVDDVEIVPLDELELAYTNRIEPGPSRNILPNASFECGPEGWASLGKPAGWGNLSGLHGEVVAGGARHGRRCLRIELGPGKTPTTYFDYFEPVAVTQHAPLAANVGWIRAKKGAPYTLSAWIRADRGGVPARLLVRQCEPGGWPSTASKDVVLSQTWQRFVFPFRPRRGWFFVAAGPDLSESRRKEATVWVDAVQVEQGPAATDFAPRAAVEVGFDTGRFGNVFAAGEPVHIVVSATNETRRSESVRLEATASDFFGKRTSLGQLRLALAPGRLTQKPWRLSLTAPGHYNVRTVWHVGGTAFVRDAPLAVIRRYAPDDSPFGVNHAPPTAGLCRLLRDAGVVWARDW